jgi:hypothetical protein
VPPGPEVRYGVHFLSSGPGVTPLLSPLAPTLGVMNHIARLVFLLAGAALTLAPMLALLSFSYGVGEPPSSHPKGFEYFAWPLLAGVGIGGGLLLVGVPNLVVGQKRPNYRNIAALLLVVSTVALFGIGFEGSVTASLGPLAILLNATAFFAFVYPATSFSIPRTDANDA